MEHQQATPPPTPIRRPSTDPATPSADLLALQRLAGNAAVVQRITAMQLTQNESKSYQVWASWAAAYGLPVAQLLLHAPTYQEFNAFLTHVKKSLDSPLPGFDVGKFVAQKLQQYWLKNPVPITGATNWGGAVTAPPVPVPTGGTAVKTATVTQAASPADPSATFFVVFSGRKHFKDLKKGTSPELPRNVTDLIAYAKVVGPNYAEVGDHWTAQLGDHMTHGGFGAYESKPWSLLVREGSSSWEVFHYGPTAKEKD